MSAAATASPLDGISSRLTVVSRHFTDFGMAKELFQVKIGETKSGLPLFGRVVSENYRPIPEEIESTPSPNALPTPILNDAGNQSRYFVRVSKIPTVGPLTVEGVITHVLVAQGPSSLRLRLPEFGLRLLDPSNIKVTDTTDLDLKPAGSVKTLSSTFVIHIDDIETLRRRKKSNAVKRAKAVKRMNEERRKVDAV